MPIIALNLVSHAAKLEPRSFLTMSIPGGRGKEMAGYTGWTLEQIGSAIDENSKSIDVLLDIQTELLVRGARRKALGKGVKSKQVSALERVSVLICELDRISKKTSNTESGIEINVKEGLLKNMGYRVGENGQNSYIVRRRILIFVYFDDLPTWFNPIYFKQHYIDQWGARITIDRLKKIADSLANFAKLRRRKLANEGLGDDLSIEQWEEDLSFLKESFYDGLYSSRDFRWPSTYVAPKIAR